MAHSKPITIALGLGALVCAAAAITWWASADRLEFYSGAGVERADAAEHDARDILWRAPEPLRKPIASPRDEFAPAVASGGPTANNELFFARVSEAGDTDLFSTERTGRAWSDPAPLVALNTLDNEQSPHLSPDGGWLYFASDRPGGEGGLDLWRSPRTDTGWGAPENLGAATNSRDNDAQPALDPSGQTLWFASDRPRPLAAPTDDAGIAPEPPEQNFDLYSLPLVHPLVVTRSDELSSNADDVSPAFSPVGDFLYFASARPSGAGGLDLYRARMTDGLPAAPRSLGPPINTPGDEADPAPASEGFELFYTSLAAGADPSASSNLLRTVSREVELGRQTEYGDLAALLRLLPWILLVLAIVLLLSMLRRLASDGVAGASLGALSLMAKCVFVSLVLHAILLALLSLWMVEPDAGQLADADSGTRVSLASSTIRSSLEAQVRASAGDPVQIAAETFPDASTPAPLNVVAAAPEHLDVAPVTTRSETALARQSNTPALSPATSAIEQLTAPLPAVASASIVLDTPAASRVERSHEAQPALDAALDVTTPAAPSALPLSELASRSSSAPLPETSRRASDERPTDRSTPSGEPDAPRLAPTHAPTLPAATAPSLALATPRGEHAEMPAPEAKTQLALGTFSGTPSPAIKLAPDPALRAQSPGVVRTEISTAPTRSLPIAAPAVPTALSIPLSTLPPSISEIALPSPQADTNHDRDAITEPVLALDPGSPDIELDDRPDAPFSRLLPERTETLTPETLSTPQELRRVYSALAAPAPGSSSRAPSPVLTSELAAMPELRIPVEVAVPEPDTLTGLVLNAVSSAPISGAHVRLDLLEADDASATSDDTGAFLLRAFDIPDNAAISASADGFIPFSANITSDELEEGASKVILLWPESHLTVALEDDPEVHHLGNDAFTGRVNSQFQRRAEGLQIEMPFTLSAEQLPPNTSGATLLMLAKGVQLDNRFYINGRRLRVTFPRSPSNGAFGEISVELPIRLFQPGVNLLGIESIRRGDTDYDDFEFVNARIQFIPAGVVID